MKKSVLDFLHSIIVLSISTALAVVLVVVFLSAAGGSVHPDPHRIVINLVSEEESFLIAVAEGSGSFTRNGISAEVRYFDSELKAVLDLDTDEITFAAISSDGWKRVVEDEGVGNIAVLASIAESSLDLEHAPGLPVLLVTRRGTVNVHPEIMSGLLTALREAERFVHEKPLAAQMILAAWMRRHPSGTRSAIPEIRYAVSTNLTGDHDMVVLGN